MNTNRLLGIIIHITVCVAAIWLLTGCQQPAPTRTSMTTVGEVIGSPVVTTDKAEESVKRATSSASKASVSVADVGRAADKAYSEGLIAGSEAADDLRRKVAGISAQLAETIVSLDNASRELSKLRTDAARSETEKENLRGALRTANERLGVAMQERDETRTAYDLSAGRIEEVKDQRNFARWGWGITAAAFALCAYLRLKGIL